MEQNFQKYLKDAKDKNTLFSKFVSVNMESASRNSVKPASGISSFIVLFIDFD